MLRKYSHFNRSALGRDWHGHCQKTLHRRVGERTVLQTANSAVYVKKKKKKGNLSHIPIPAVNDQSIKSHLRQYGTGSIAVTCKSKD